MAGLADKLIAQVPFKAGGDVFHHLMAYNPNHFAKCAPTKIQLCELQQGAFGTSGSVIEWKYSLDGKDQVSKQVIEVDDEKRQTTLKMIGGDFLELYKNMVVTCHVETKGGIDYITWTIDYELLNAENPHPITLLNFLIGMTKDAEAHIFG